MSSATHRVSISRLAPTIARERHSRRCVDSHSFCSRMSSQTLVQVDARSASLGGTGSESLLLLISLLAVRRAS